MKAQKELIAPVGIPVVLGFFYFWIRYFKNPITWVTLSFFIFHSSIGHKEFRYIFPIAMFVPLILTVSFRDFFNKIKTDRIKLIWVTFFVSLNLIVYFRILLKPAYDGINFYEYLYDNPKITKVFYNSANRPNQIINSAMLFYRIDDREYVRVKDVESVSDNSFYFHSSSGREYLKLKNKENCEELHPKLNSMGMFLRYGRKIEKTDVFSLFACKKS